MPHLKLHLRSNGLRPWCVCRTPCWLDLDQKHWGCCVLPGQQNSAAHTNGSCLVIQVLTKHEFHFLILLREVWPEGDVFGSADVEHEEELELLKQILKANLPSTLLNCILMFPLVIRASLKRLIISWTFNFRVISSWACDRGWGWWSGVRRGRVGVCPGFWKRVQLSWLYQEVMKTVNFNIQ